MEKGKYVLEMLNRKKKKLKQKKQQYLEVVFL